MAAPKLTPAQKKLYREKREATVYIATPAWADFDVINAFYVKAKQLRKDGVPVQVDHIIPLTHPLVCGLHCEHNLQILLAKDNSLKSNTLDGSWQPFDIVIYRDRIYGKVLC